LKHIQVSKAADDESEGDEERKEQEKNEDARKSKELRKPHYLPSIVSEAVGQ
jgi:hypothetical protein